MRFSPVEQEINRTISQQQENSPYWIKDEPHTQGLKLCINLVDRVYAPRAWDVYINESYAYLATDEGLIIIDISNPTASVKVGIYDDSHYDRAFGVCVNGIYAYVADEKDGLEIIDVSKPNEPVEVGQLDNYGYGDESGYDWSIAHDIEIKGTCAYLIDPMHGLVIIDISNPYSPIKVGQFLGASPAESIYLFGSYAFVARGFSGMMIIDISDPKNPELVGKFNNGDNVQRIFVSGSYAYLANDEFGLKIIDISNPESPLLVGQFYDGPADWGASGIFVNGSYTYVADGIDGLEIIDSSNPKNPTEIGQFDDPYPFTNVYVLGSYIYVSATYGLEILTTYWISPKAISQSAMPKEINFYSAIGLSIFFLIVLAAFYFLD